MFEGIEDSSDDESLHSYEGGGDDDEGRFEMEGKEVGRRESADKEADNKEAEKSKKENEGEEGRIVV
jgi:SIT4-associating protein SAP185/190